MILQSNVCLQFIISAFLYVNATVGKSPKWHMIIYVCFLSCFLVRQNRYPKYLVCLLVKKEIRFGEILSQMFLNF